MTMNKNLLAIAIAMGQGLSGAAFADQGGDGSPNTNADDGSTATYGDADGAGHSTMASASNEIGDSSANFTGVGASSPQLLRGLP
ncbi:hypothetical protein [Marinobacter sp. F4206]|uniref:hypothetical protein n=1 Tax=Marinobacter sp. F4206 TaxID=2861777 RepID=UPI001C5E4170|nr:hypothetical protein [Marinobacter sp. F4206]MBW4934578.1 hypothetical protein [Marinobacter sp. F4206]